MDFHISNSLRLLIFLSILCLQSRAEATGSVLFLDSPTHQFLRTPSSDAPTETVSMLLPEVGAAVSVLLGFAPPATLSAASSSKLNEVLMPNPFDRPRAVFMMEVRDSQLFVDPDVLFSSASRSTVILGSSKADIHLPDEDEVSVVSLDEPLSINADCTDKELNDFASWLGGSYVTNALEPLSGELTFPLASGADFNLHMSKKADREFTASLVSLIRNIRKAIEMHQDFSGSVQNPAELMTGCFDGIKGSDTEVGLRDVYMVFDTMSSNKMNCHFECGGWYRALQEEYGLEGVALQGMELFLTTISKMFDSLQAAYKGRIVGVIFFNGTPPPESETMLNVMFTSRSSSRWLEEKESSTNSTSIAEVVLVRLTLAWITGIILLIATLLGIYFLLYMPITRDTLLYSNVKLD